MMIEGIEEIYQRIAGALVDVLPDKWRVARIQAVFFPESSEYHGEYVTESGEEQDCEVTMEASRAFRDLRRKFKDAGQPLWGQAHFELFPTGKFNMKWGYENCDKNGDTIWNEDEWHRQLEERRNRLSQK